MSHNILWDIPLKTTVLFVESRIEGVKVFGIQFILHDTGRFAEALVVDDLPFPQKLDDIPDVRIIHQTENIVIAHPGLLFSSQILMEIGEDITG